MALELINSLDTAGNAFNKNNEAINNIIVSGALIGNVLTYTTFSGATIEVTLPTTESGTVLLTQSGSIDIAPGCTIEVPALQYTYNGEAKETIVASFAFVAPDPTLDRVDSIILDPVTNSVSIVNGTPANPPVSPTITDPNFLLGSIYVFAGQPCENSTLIYSAINTQLATILSQLTIDLINGAGGGVTIPVYPETLYVDENFIGGDGSFTNPFETIKDAIDSAAINIPTEIRCLGGSPEWGVGTIDLTDKDIYVNAKGRGLTSNSAVFVNINKRFILECDTFNHTSGIFASGSSNAYSTIRVNNFTNTDFITTGINFSLFSTFVTIGSPIVTGVDRVIFIDFEEGTGSSAIGSSVIRFNARTLYTSSVTPFNSLKFSSIIQGTFVLTGTARFCSSASSTTKFKNIVLTGNDELADAIGPVEWSNCIINVRKWYGSTSFAPDSNKFYNCLFTFGMVGASANQYAFVVRGSSVIKNCDFTIEGSDSNGIYNFNATKISDTNIVIDDVLNVNPVHIFGASWINQGGNFYHPMPTVTPVGTELVTVKDGNDYKEVLASDFLGGGGGAVSSVFGRVGAVVAQLGDYLANLVSYNNATSGLTATNVQDAIDENSAGIGGVAVDLISHESAINNPHDTSAENLITTETDTALFAKPDGLGGITFGTSGLAQVAWSNYADTQYTTGARRALTGGVRTKMANNGLSAITTYMPAGVDFYNNSTEKITPQGIGETYEMRINFSASSGTINNYAVMQLDIGGGQGVIVERVVTFPRGSGVDHKFSMTTSIFALGTFVSNGGELFITPDSAMDIWDVSYSIVRNNASNVDIPEAPIDNTTYGRNNGAWVATGGASFLTGTATIIQGTWSGNTNYEYTLTVTGASIGDVVYIQPDNSVLNAMRLAGANNQCYAYVGAINTVTVVCRTSTFLTVPGGSIFTVKVFK